MILTVLLDSLLVVSAILAIAGFAAVVVSRKRVHAGSSETFFHQIRNFPATWRILVRSSQRAAIPLIAAILVAGVGAGAAALRPTLATAAATSVTITKIKNIGIFNGAKATFQFNFIYKVHKSLLFVFGETVHVVGTGTDVAEVDFSALADSQVNRSGPASIMLVLPKPYLGSPVVDLHSTELADNNGIFTVLSHLFKNDPNVAVNALAAAQSRIEEAAVTSSLISRAEVSTRGFLSTLLRRLGYRDVVVKFV